MVLLYPLLIVVAVLLAWRRRSLDIGRGSVWFLSWAVAGFLLSFSFVTGLSIGLLIVPAAAVALLWTATRSPHLREGSGFLVGILGTAALVVLVNYA